MYHPSAIEVRNVGMVYDAILGPGAYRNVNYVDLVFQSKSPFSFEQFADGTATALPSFSEQQVWEVRQNEGSSAARRIWDLVNVSTGQVLYRIQRRRQLGGGGPNRWYVDSVDLSTEIAGPFTGRNNAVAAAIGLPLV